MEPEYTYSTTSPRMAETQPSDLFALRDILQGHVERAQQLGFRSHAAADTVFGSRPLAAGGNATDRERPPLSLAELVSDLGSALNNLEAGLNRL